MAITRQNDLVVHGGGIIKAEKTFINNLLKATSYKRRRKLLKQATKKQLAALLQIAWNLTSHRQARLATAQKTLLKRFYGVLQKCFFEIRRLHDLRKLLNTPGLLPSILAPLHSNRGLVAAAILSVLR